MKESNHIASAPIPPSFPMSNKAKFRLKTAKQKAKTVPIQVKV
jgi:hypothetical protein